MRAAIRRRVTILGATGSIGRSTAAVILDMQRSGAAEVEVEALTGGRNVAEMRTLASALRPRFVAMADEAAAAELAPMLAGQGVAVGGGAEAVREAAARPADWVMAAIVGAAGLAPTCEALARGATVAIANKESLVCAGPLVMGLARASGAHVIPVDSEHNAVFQVATHRDALTGVTLTASGGPFRDWTWEAMQRATVAQARRHPKWDMGLKNSLDSATLMNKGLELIEAGYLFDLEETQIALTVHPQSIVHAFAHYQDGSTLAQLSPPDMRVPIAYALTWPERRPIDAPRLDLHAIGALTFEAVDAARFPAPGLARAALRAGCGATAALNAANEVAVEAFVEGRIGFLEIAAVAEEILDASMAARAGLNAKTPSSFAEVHAIDASARRLARRAVGRRAAA